MNLNEDFPVVVGGWEDAHSYYNLPNDVVIYVGYYGNNIFEIAGIAGIEAREQLPSFHSRFTNRKGIYVFDVLLSSNTMSTRKIVE